VQQPNYLGNLMLWGGVLVLNVPAVYRAAGRNPVKGVVHKYKKQCVIPTENTCK
jgi:hypothetical protein